MPLPQQGDGATHDDRCPEALVTQLTPAGLEGPRPRLVLAPSGAILDLNGASHLRT